MARKTEIDPQRKRNTQVVTQSNRNTDKDGREENVRDNQSMVKIGGVRERNLN